MNAKTKSKLLQSYGSYSKAELAETKSRAEAFLANPGEANAEAIESAQNSIEVLDELLAAPEASQQPPQQPAAPAQPFEEKHAKLITAKMNAGLTREGAIEVIKHQLENDARRKAAKK